MENTRSKQVIEESGLPPELDGEDLDKQQVERERDVGQSDAVYGNVKGIDVPVPESGLPPMLDNESVERSEGLINQDGDLKNMVDNFDDQGVPDDEFVPEKVRSKSTMQKIKLFWKEGPSLKAHFLYFCSISIFAYAGVIIRVYLEKLSKYDGFESFSPLWPEIIGCVIMGFFVQQKGKMMPHQYAPLAALFIGISTGLCGSITTFSTWNASAIKALVDFDNTINTSATRVWTWITVTVAGVAIPFGALRFGNHLGMLYNHMEKRFAKDTGKKDVEGGKKESLVPKNIVYSYMDWMLIIAFIPVTVFVIVLSNQLDRDDYVFDFVFALAGANLRYQLSFLNKLHRKFFFGTFAANILGCALLGLFTVLQKDLSLTTLQNNVFIGLETGFCGCLTTISTFIVEVELLSVKSSNRYAWVSIIVAQLFFIVTLGTYTWATS
eukprot:Nk52_evm19s248 gene=Nk52_evmTU19s248